MIRWNAACLTSFQCVSFSVSYLDEKLLIRQTEKEPHTHALAGFHNFKKIKLISARLRISQKMEPHVGRNGFQFLDSVLIA